MIDHPKSWLPQQHKFKTPRELLISSCRAFDIELNDDELLISLQSMGQQPFAAGSPAGYGDISADWDGPEALITRIEWANQFSFRVSNDTTQIASNILDSQLTPHTAQILKRAESQQQAAALLLMSPEFQHR